MRQSFALQKEVELLRKALADTEAKLAAVRHEAEQKILALERLVDSERDRREAVEKEHDNETTQLDAAKNAVLAANSELAELQARVTQPFHTTVATSPPSPSAQRRPLHACCHAGAMQERLRKAHARIEELSAALMNEIRRAEAMKVPTVRRVSRVAFVRSSAACRLVCVRPCAAFKLAAAHPSTEWNRKADGVQSEASVAKQEAVAAQAEAEKLHNALMLAQSAQHDMRNQLDEERQASTRAQADLANAKREIAQLTSELAAARARAADFEKARVQAEQALSAAQARAAQAERDAAQREKAAMEKLLSLQQQQAGSASDQHEKINALVQV